MDKSRLLKTAACMGEVLMAGSAVCTDSVVGAGRVADDEWQRSTLGMGKSGTGVGNKALLPTTRASKRHSHPKYFDLYSLLLLGPPYLAESFYSTSMICRVESVDGEIEARDHGGRVKHPIRVSMFTVEVLQTSTSTKDFYQQDRGLAPPASHRCRSAVTTDLHVLPSPTLRNRG